MIKYIKWILLVILIFCLLIFGIKFLNYNNEEAKINISDIYGTDWYKFGIAFYENKKLITENKKVTGLYRMSFDNEKVTYCNLENDKCNEYTYSYDGEKITINSEDYFIPNGTYNIKLEDGVLILSIKDGIYTIVYYLNSSSN